MHAFADSKTDLDDDGDLDVVGADFLGGGLVSWWENTIGDGSVWAEHAINVDDRLAISRAGR